MRLIAFFTLAWLLVLGAVATSNSENDIVPATTSNYASKAWTQLNMIPIRKWSGRARDHLFHAYNAHMDHDTAKAKSHLKSSVKAMCAAGLHYGACYLPGGSGLTSKDVYLHEGARAAVLTVSHLNEARKALLDRNEPELIRQVGRVCVHGCLTAANYALHQYTR
jgi:hypothetical protein